jgi:hypothetical protein
MGSAGSFEELDRSAHFRRRVLLDFKIDMRILIAVSGSNDGSSDPVAAAASIPWTA